MEKSTKSSSDTQTIHSSINIDMALDRASVEIREEVNAKVQEKTPGVVPVSITSNVDMLSMLDKLTKELDLSDMQHNYLENVWASSAPALIMVSPS